MMHSAERKTMPTLVEVRNEQTRLAIYAVLTAYFGATDHEKDRAQEWVNKYENRVSEASDDVLDIVTFSDPAGLTDPDMKHILLIGSILMMATLGLTKASSYPSSQKMLASVWRKPGRRSALSQSSPDFSNLRGTTANCGGAPLLCAW